MNVDSAVTWLSWALAALGAVALVLLVLVRRWAGRAVVVGVAALLAVVVFAVRLQIAAIPVDNPEPLCTNGVSWFGMHLTGPDSLCAKYR